MVAPSAKLALGEEQTFVPAGEVFVLKERVSDTLTLSTHCARPFRDCQGISLAVNWQCGAAATWPGADTGYARRRHTHDAAALQPRRASQSGHHHQSQLPPVGRLSGGDVD